MRRLPIRDLEQGRCPLSEVGAPVLLTGLLQFGALLCTEVQLTGAHRHPAFRGGGDTLLPPPSSIIG
ncbi:MAG TPA: hypothetical protein VJN88_15645 [Ktedonobacterales bacterium]|nr:hypothetical protein [Ktedonobacterales bacterium]